MKGNEVAILTVFLSLVVTGSPHPQPGRYADAGEGLSKRLYVSMKARPLADALREISSASEVQMSASPEVAETRVTFILNGLSVKDAQENLAELLHLTWRTEADHASGSLPRYVLFKSRANREEEARLINRGEAAFRQGMERAIRALTLSTDDLEELKKRDLGVYLAVTNPQGRASIELLASLPTPQRAKLFDGEQIAIPLIRMSGELRQSLQGALNGQPLHDDSTVLFSRIGKGNESALAVLINKGQNRGTRRFTHAPQYATEAYEQVQGQERSPKEYVQTRRPIRPIRLLEFKCFDDVLEHIASSLKINVLAESYTSLYRLPAPAHFEGAHTIEQLLDSIVWANQVWWKRDATYMFQRKTWFIDRLAEVPESVLSRIKALRRQGLLTLEEWAETLGNLRREQWMMLQTIGLGEFDLILDHLPLLAFYGKLHRMHRRAAFERSGLAIERLSKNRLADLRSWIGTQANLSDFRSLTVFATSDGNGTLFRALGELPNGIIKTVREESVPGRSSLRK